MGRAETESMDSTDYIQVPILTRVEGEGGVTIRLQDGNVAEVQLRIYEPPRLFEALLRGRPLEDVPDITARICGICPVAYQMSSVHALEDALGIRITPQIRQLRRLLYCGEWIESHALHIHLLHAPDFFDVTSGIELAKRFPMEMKRGMQLKKYGNRLLEILGGRAIHPINVTVGGFYHLPSRHDLTDLIPHFEQGIEDATNTARWVAGFSFPEFDQPYEYVALSHPDEYPMNEGDICSSSGLRISVRDFGSHFVEQQVPHSTALHSVKKNQDSYLLGPLPRVVLNRSRLSRTAQKVADEIRFPTDCTNPFMSIIARSLELIHAYDEALSIIKSYNPMQPGHVDYERHEGYGCAATEAPRGLLFHEYRVATDGTIESGRIVPPTSQNQRQIEKDIADYIGRSLRLSATKETMAIECERLVRAYDPCISCSTHFLKVKWEGN